MGKTRNTDKKHAGTDRKDRLAAALRDNLKRRKIRQRNSQALEPHEPGVSPPQNRTEDTK